MKNRAAIAVMAGIVAAYLVLGVFYGLTEPAKLDVAFWVPAAGILTVSVALLQQQTSGSCHRQAKAADAAGARRDEDRRLG